MPSIAYQVPTGPYQWFTMDELNAQQTAYKAAVKAAASRLISSNINGQLMTYGPTGQWTLAEWQWNLAVAYNLLDPGLYPYPPAINAAVIVSR